MRLFKFGIPIFGVLTLATGLVGCADESHWGSSSNEKGSISLTLSTNRDIATAKPVFRSGEESRADDPNDLNTYINVPEAADFKVKLEKADGSYSKTWSSLNDFKEEATSSKFPTGAYTLTAYYGEKGTQDFEAPYFEASSSFTVLSDKTQEVNLEAELQNSMVKINYTQAFKDYMSNFYSKIHTEGRTDDITYGMVESRPAFLEPNNANVTVHFTTKDKGYTSSISLGEFAPAAKTLHNITFDIVESQNGTPSLNVSFDETLEDEDINIDLTDELFTTPAPVITCEGFTNGETVNMLEGTGSDVSLKMNVKAEGKIKSAVLTVDSPNFTPSWGEEYDLCKAFADNKVSEIKNAGIDATGFGFSGQPTDMEGYLTLTDFGKSLPKGVHTISLTVTDQTGKVSEPAVVVLNSEEITIDMVGEPTIVYGSGQAVLTLDYNGINPNSDISFQAVGSDGYYTSARIISCDENTATRAFEKKRYVYTIELPVTTKSSIGIQVYHKETRLVGEFQVPVTVPAYRIAEEYNAYTNHAYLRVTTPNSTDPSVLAAVINNLIVKGNGDELKITKRDTSNGIVTISELKPATTYSITSSITGTDENSVWNNFGDLLTETESNVPNGDFEDINQTINTTINQGGLWTITAAGKTHQTTLSMNIKEPQGWISSNSMTCNLSANNKNSWYVIPSVFNTTLSWVSHQPEAKAIGIGQSAKDTTADIYTGLKSNSKENAMVIRNVAWDLNGPSIADKKQTGNSDFSNYYCSNKPNSIANRTAGYLYLGTSTEQGTNFASRPVKLKGFYMYENDSQDKGEKGKITVEILNGNQILGSGQIELGAANEYSEFVIPIEYISPEESRPKATKLKIYITSSNKTSDIKTTDYCNKDECCSRGAALTVDNLTFEY
ncbi:MAG: DUF4493 domain-containing protein [Muribaculaceae bacterium]|nr:DUF4493 domain-containing protein [Muribaculaceae bacterium]